MLSAKPPVIQYCTQGAEGKNSISSTLLYAEVPH